MNEVLNNLKTRRSIRKYEPTPVPDELLDQILEAGLYAASGMGKQCTTMVAVRDKETRDLLSRLNAEIMGTSSDPFFGAPCVIVVLADPERYTFVEDGSLVIGNLMEAAHSLGLGSCWIHRAREMFYREEGRALLKKWGLPENLRGIGNCVIGYPADIPAAKPRREGRIIKV